MFELAIIGGGPAGVSAGIYAARKQLKTLFITDSFGGQSTESVGIENWVGTKKISGPDFGKMLEEHLRSQSADALEIRSGEKVVQIAEKDGDLEIKTDKGSYSAQTVLVTTGSTRKKLEIPGAKEFENKGITYCASCDGPLFAGQDVAVIGGGNAAFETAAQLLAYAKSVTLFNRGEKFRADEITVRKVLSHANMKALTNVSLKEIKGGKFVESIVYEKDGKTAGLPVGGIFVEIGLMPTTDFVKDLIKLNKFGQIPVDPKTQRTELEDLWAAGDSTDGLFHQNNIASGDAVKALEDIYLYLRAR